MNGTNFFQPLESRTMFNAVLPPVGDPGGAIASNLTIQVEHALPPGGGATADGGGGATGSGNGSIGQDGRQMFRTALVRPD